jgi:hypothetical protein
MKNEQAHGIGKGNKNRAAIKRLIAWKMSPYVLFPHTVYANVCEE